MKKLAALVSAIALAACGSGGPPTQPTVALSNPAFAYLNAILTLMEHNSIKQTGT